jgi:hypothetical protein
LLPISYPAQFIADEDGENSGLLQHRASAGLLPGRISVSGWVWKLQP